MSDEYTHVDDFVGASFAHSSESERYARFFFLLARLPSALSIDFHPWIRQHKLFCTYEGKRYRVTGASRMGDIWLAEDFEQDTGYDHRVFVDECCEFSPTETYVENVVAS
jgi:hypothetical protein